MSEVQDHVVFFPDGFYDMNRYPERVEHGGKRTVTRSQFRQMRNSDPTIELRKIQPPKDVLQRIVTQARQEKAERDASGALVEEAPPIAGWDDVGPDREATPEEDAEQRDWKPIGWYAAQLAKGEKDD